MMDANIIATLVAISDRAKKLFKQHQDNRQRGSFTDANSDFPPYIQLTFHNPPKRIQDGFTFGKHLGSDVQLTDQHVQEMSLSSPNNCVSNIHFSITIDLIDGEFQVILKDTSTCGTTVSYDGLGETETRNHFTWIMFPDFNRIVMDIKVAGITFELQLGRHRDSAEYLASANSMVQERRKLEASGLRTPFERLLARAQETPGISTPPGGEPVYLLLECIGEGRFGQVFRALDASTGVVYALKTFITSGGPKEMSMLKRLSHVSVYTVGHGSCH